MNKRKYPACLSVFFFLLYPPLAGCHRITARDFVFYQGVSLNFPLIWATIASFPSRGLGSGAMYKKSARNTPSLKPLNGSDNDAFNPRRTDDYADKILTRHGRIACVLPTFSHCFCLSVCYVTFGENRTQPWNKEEQSAIEALKIIMAEDCTQTMTALITHMKSPEDPVNRIHTFTVVINFDK